PVSWPRLGRISASSGGCPLCSAAIRDSRCALCSGRVAAGRSRWRRRARPPLRASKLRQSVRYVLDGAQAAACRCTLPTRTRATADPPDTLRSFSTNGWSSAMRRRRRRQLLAVPVELTAGGRHLCARRISTWPTTASRFHGDRSRPEFSISLHSPRPSQRLRGPATQFQPAECTFVVTPKVGM
uniref:Nuclear receptor domain-containing protein n=1 Tax=Macrostomum lignano TaxID=282301 RepID=A0A1I8FEX0_9PLAT